MATDYPVQIMKQVREQVYTNSIIEYGGLADRLACLAGMQLYTDRPIITLMRNQVTNQIWQEIGSPLREEMRAKFGNTLTGSGPGENNGWSKRRDDPDGQE